MRPGNLIPHPVLPPREVQIEKAALIYRAMKGDAEAQETVTFEDIQGLRTAGTFELFLLLNAREIKAVERY